MTKCVDVFAYLIEECFAMICKVHYLKETDILYWSLSFWLTSLCIVGSSFIHLIRTDSNELFLMAE